MNEFAQTDQRVFARLKQLGFKPQGLFDVGASNAGWSVRISTIFPEARYDLFEPLADYAGKYRALLADNLRGHPNFHLHKIALGAATGQASVRIMDEAFGGTTLDLPHLQRPPTAISVPMLTIDDAIEQLQLPVPQVIKMDVQGGELAVLRGAQKTLPQVDVVLGELWLVRGYGPHTPLLHEVIRWLADSGFYLWELGDCYRKTEDALWCQDCFFLNARCPISPLHISPATATPPPKSPTPPSLGRRLRNLFHR